MKLFTNCEKIPIFVWKNKYINDLDMVNEHFYEGDGDIIYRGGICFKIDTEYNPRNCRTTTFKKEFGDYDNSFDYPTNQTATNKQQNDYCN